jgi:hypothetical protein
VQAPQPVSCEIYSDEWNNRHDSLSYDGVVYACSARFDAPRYARRALLVPGAVMVLVHDGAETRCHVYRVVSVEDAIRALEVMDVEHASSLHVWPGGAPPEVWRLVCLR